MKTYKVKNYKGNLLESVTNFQKKYDLARIVEVSEKDGGLKIVVKESISDDEKRENNSVSIESVTIEDLIHIAEFVGGYVLDKFKVPHNKSVVSIAHKFNDILDDDSEAQHSGDLLLDINEHTDEALTKLYEKDRMLAVKMYKMLNEYRINKRNGSRDINRICPTIRKLSHDHSKPMELLYGLFKNIFFYADDIRSGVEYF